MSTLQADDFSPAWDEGLAAYAPGKYVLIALTHVNGLGEIVKQTQMHGVIESVDRQSGFVVSLRGARQGQAFTLPADARAFRLSELGHYQLHETGEVITNLDLIAAWTVTGPQG